MPGFASLFDVQLFGNALAAWGTAIAVATAAFVLLLFVRRALRRWYAHVASTERRELVEVPLRVLERTRALFLLVLAASAGFTLIELGPRATTVGRTTVLVVIGWQLGVWASAGASAWLEHRREWSLSHDRASLGSLAILRVLANVVIWALVGLLTLDNLGVDITALVAGLGIGGIAVALAVQNVLGDLFASLSIALDRPFAVGDFVGVGDFLGTVEHVGIKSTRLRSLSGEQIVISNADLLATRLRNYGRMSERRVEFATSVTYETPIERLERIPSLVRTIVESQPDVRFDRCHFKRHGPDALEFETVYYVLSADYNRFMDLQQTINLELHRGLATLGVEFAYPTQRLLVQRVPAEDGMRRRAVDATRSTRPHATS